MFIPSTTQLIVLTRPPDIRPTYDDVVFRRQLTLAVRPVLRLVGPSTADASIRRPESSSVALRRDGGCVAPAPPPMPRDRARGRRRRAGSGAID